ncbi:MAG: alkaline phosphatase family protein [Chloroflexota bacterium]|nr:alkaline phosphatase family protein [Chloroflexota bacterium]
MPDTLFDHDEFIAPDYQGGCFSQIPQFIKAVLVEEETSDLHPDGFAPFPQRYQNVIVLFVDAFGWRFFEQHRSNLPFLRRFADQGSATRLTSQFPSTTAAHVTTFYTGLPVGQHGVFEWGYYEPKLDTMIWPLPFSFAGDHQPETLRTAGITGPDILPTGEALGQQLAGYGVTTTILQPAPFARSTYSDLISRGADIMPYKTLAEALVNLTELLDRQQGASLAALYFGMIDGIMHEYGPDSPQAQAEIESCFSELERWFRRDAGRLPSDTLVLLTADHGQVTVDPEETVYLHQLPQFHKLEPMLRVNSQGHLLIPGGSCRDMFLYVNDAALAGAQALLQEDLQDTADIVQTSTLIQRGYFGPLPVSDAFLSRVGNLVILPRDNGNVWWYEEGRFDQPYRGHHGGLTRAEMEIPLLLLPLVS